MFTPLDATSCDVAALRAKNAVTFFGLRDPLVLKGLKDDGAVILCRFLRICVVMCILSSEGHCSRHSDDCKGSRIPVVIN